MNQHNFTPDENEKLDKDSTTIPHIDILEKLLDGIELIDFRKRAAMFDDEAKLKKKHYLVITIEEILAAAKRNNWDICQNNGTIYLFNGSFWNPISESDLEDFLGNAAEKIGVEKFEARVFYFREALLKQFMKTANFPKPKKSNESVKVNLKNGTFEVSLDRQFLRTPDRRDFLTHQLNFNYDNKKCFPLFQQFLNKVLPDISSQQVLAEYIAYLFIPTSKLKLEKALFLYGQGANGKSVFFEIIMALLGTDNVSNYLIQSLTSKSGNSRALIADKLANYSTEINGTMDSDFFKQLISGEPIEARWLYEEYFTINDYAKLMFNCNELPTNVEHNNAFFRRFLIIPFNVTIPEHEQDKELARKIIESELSGVFNWVLEGMQRLLKQRKFTESELITEATANYKKQSDSVSLFLEEFAYKPSTESTIALKVIYDEYKAFCKDFGFVACSSRKFGERLKNNNIQYIRQSQGNMVYVKKDFMI